MPNLSGAQRKGPCVHLGDHIRTEPCTTCRGNVQLKVFDCLHSAHSETDFKSCGGCEDYELQLRSGDVKTWAIGVTTAPRKTPTLGRTLASLEEAGFQEVRVFAEPDSEVPDSSIGGKITIRDETIGAWPNWYLALSELYLRTPRADAYMLVQDDVVMCRGLRRYLERQLWPHHRVGFVSIYRSAGYRELSPGFSEVSLAEGMLGALTLIFPNFAARSLLADHHTLAHRLRGRQSGLAHIDDVVGFWARKSRLGGWVHTPSLAQHIGEESAIWGSTYNLGKRIASDFVGQEFDAQTLLESEQSN